MFRILSPVTQHNCMITALNICFWRKEKLVLEKDREGTGLLKYGLHR